MKKQLSLFLVTIFLADILIAGIIWNEFKPQPLLFYVFDVGQGDGLMIRTPGRQTIVVDGGYDNQIIYKLGQYLPFYERTIDLLVLSHPDADHLAGLVETLRRYDVKNILANNVEHKSATYAEWREEIYKSGINYLEAGVVKEIKIDNNLILSILYPVEIISGAVKEVNATSIIFAIEYGDSSILLTGDTTKEVEKFLVSQNKLSQFDVLKVAHHGSDTSSDQSFLETIKPKLAIISSGRDNKYGHPHQAVLDRFIALGISYINTAVQGDIVVAINGLDIYQINLKQKWFCGIFPDDLALTLESCQK